MRTEQTPSYRKGYGLFDIPNPFGDYQREKKEGTEKLKPDQRKNCAKPSEPEHEKCFPRKPGKK